VARRRGRGEGHLYQRSDGRWEAVLQADFPDGTKRRSFYAATQWEARQKLDKAKADLRSGIMPTPERMTTAAYLRAWVDGKRGQVRDNTWRRYAGIIDKNIIPAIGNVPLVRLASTDVNRMTSGMQQRGLAAQTAAHARSVLRLALGQAVEDNILPRNIATTRRTAVSVERPAIAATTPELARKISAAFIDHPLGAFVTIALSTGSRSGELRALRWSDIDFDRKLLRVERTLQIGADGQLKFESPKSKRSRRMIDLSDDEVNVLLTHRDRQRAARVGSVLVFSRPDGEPLRAAETTHAFQRALRQAGLPRMRLHDLRHANATLLLASGVPIQVVSDRLGHADVRTTMGVYVHVLPMQKRDAADRMQELLRGTGS
jgi:integrase